MEKRMRLIDADKLKKALGITSKDCSKCNWGSYESCGRGKEFEDICIAIDSAVTVDAVPVIRCDKCDFWDRDHISCEGLAKCLTGEGGIRYRNRSDFCSKGRKKDGNKYE